MNFSRPATGLLILALMAAATSSFGFTQANQNEQYEIRLVEFDLHNYQTVETLAAERMAVEATVQQHGGAWHVASWNPQTQTPALLLGSGVERSVSLTDDASVESAARNVILESREALRAENADLVFEQATRGMGKVSAFFQQTYEGLEVWGGRVNLTFLETGRLFVMGSEFYSNIDIDIRPSIPASVAQEIARRDVPFNPATDSIEDETRLLILPVPTAVDAIEYHLVWETTVNTNEPLGSWVTHVDANTGDVVRRYNNIHFLNYTGDTETSVQEHTHCNGESLFPQPYMNISISGVGSTTSDSNGDWVVPYLGTGTNTLTATFFGPYCNVNVFGTPPDAVFTGTPTAGVPFTIDWNDSNARQDERDVFEAISRVHDFFEPFAPGFNSTSTLMTAYVNRTGSCNAYWNGTINFYPQVGSCANTGEIQGVVEHEFGHDVQNQAVGSQGGQGLGEGNSDVLANLVTQESVIGRGFYVSNCVSGIRDSDNTLSYPDDVLGQTVHNAGRVIAGVHWDLMLLLQDLYGTEAGTLKAAELWHNCRILGHPLTQPLQVMWLFTADDDDGNVANGTPHYDLICEAAGNHGFSCPTITEGIFITHAPNWTVTESGDQTINANIFTTDGTLTMVDLRYTINGGPEQILAMTNTLGDGYAAVLPNVQIPTEITYFIDVEDSAGNSKSDPPSAPEVLHDFDVATYYDALELGSGWVVNLEGTDTASSTASWVREDPNPTPIQAEYDTTPDPGVLCWLTGQAPVGGGTSSQGAVINARTTLYSPEYDLSGATVASVKYAKWYRNDGGGEMFVDPWVVQARNDGGAWVEVENSAAVTEGWESVKFDIASLFGGGLGNVQFKFIVEDVSPTSLVDGALDDFTILAVLDPADVDLEAVSATPRFSLVGSSPNPTRGDVTIGFQVPAATQVQLRIYDVTGREIRTLQNGSVEAGLHLVEWDGKDAQGRDSASGVYFYQMSAEGFRATKSLVLSR